MELIIAFLLGRQSLVPPHGKSLTGIVQWWVRVKAAVRLWINIQNHASGFHGLSILLARTGGTQFSWLLLQPLSIGPFLQPSSALLELSKIALVQNLLILQIKVGRTN